MEKASNIACVPAEFSWQDIGTWGSVRDAFMRDSAGNVTSGEVFLLDTNNSVIHSDGPTIAAIGCNNMVIVASKDAVLVMPEGKDQEVKHVAEWLAKRKEQSSK
jgi:mannose-1-phosphate guanylyltransferase